VYVFPTWPLTARTQIARPTSIAGDPKASGEDRMQIIRIDSNA
jgi:hypothetical protein